MKKDILFTNGCSFTHGGGLDPWFTFFDGQSVIERYGTSDMTEYWNDYNTLMKNGELHRVTWDDSIRKKMVWPHFLGKLMGIQNVVNLSMGCGSNNRIIRTTLEWLTTQSPSTLKNTFAVVQLSEPSRYEYYEPEFDHWADCKVDHCGSKASSDVIVKESIERNKLRLSSFTHEEGVLKFITECTCLHQMFTHFDVEYKFCCLNNPFLYLKEVRPEMENFKNHEEFLTKSCNWIDDNISDSSFFRITNNPDTDEYINSDFCLPHDPHFSEQGNQLLANIMYDLIIR